ncbi:MAG: MaoC family dehydratase [Micromonosporaceae bacterium]|nr:MaoC family dehydratase [Micromonosporaceae bacterium]
MTTEGQSPMTTDGAEPARTVEQRGLWYEEFVEGTRYLHRPGRTVTEADNVLFSTLTMNPQALHLDAAWSARQPFGQRLVNSMFTLATMVGASVSQLTQGTIVANLGLTEVSFPHPLYHGDTLYCETVVLSKRLSASRPGQGIVTLEHIGRNQDGVVVGRAVRAVLMWLRDHAPADGSGPVPADGAGSTSAAGSESAPADGSGS